MESEKYFVGIDPGALGVTSLISESKEEILIFPYKSVTSSSSILRYSIRESLQNYAPLIKHVVMEEVHAIYGASASATFSFGWINGYIESILDILELPYTKVSPQTWQKEMFQGIEKSYKPSHSSQKMIINTKVMSIQAAQRLFPKTDLRRTTKSTKIDNNVSDSLLMAEYCRRHF